MNRLIYWWNRVRWVPLKKALSESRHHPFLFLSSSRLNIVFFSCDTEFQKLPRTQSFLYYPIIILVISIQPANSAHDDLQRVIQPHDQDNNIFYQADSSLMSHKYGIYYFPALGTPRCWSLTRYPASAPGAKNQNCPKETSQKDSINFSSLFLSRCHPVPPLCTFTQICRSILGTTEPTKAPTALPYSYSKMASEGGWDDTRTTARMTESAPSCCRLLRLSKYLALPGIYLCTIWYLHFASLNFN